MAQINLVQVIPRQKCEYCYHWLPANARSVVIVVAAKRLLISHCVTACPHFDVCFQIFIMLFFTLMLLPTPTMLPY